jgi:hypothetical protein
MATAGPRGATRGRAAVDRATWAIVALVAVRLVVAASVLVDPPADDPWIVRAETVATSPATPYRDFPVATMPLETAAIEALGGDGASALARRVALVALAADLAAAAALAWGWRRATAAAYLLLGLPLLAVASRRLDLVAVALAAWGAALLRRRADLGAGAALAAGVAWKLWPVALVPALWLGRRHRALVAGGAVVAAVGAWWFLWGGREGPFQVLTSRGALGWAVESTVGNLVWIVTRGQTVLEAGVTRIGVVPTWAKALLLIAMAATVAVVWIEAARDRAHDPFGGTALAATAALVVFAPVSPALHAAWLLPWAAVAWDGDREERRVATLAALAVAASGLLALRDPAEADVVVKWLAFARNALEVAAIASWLTRPATTSAAEVVRRA